MEAAIFLPLVLLAVLSLGYFMRVEGTWENCIHGAVDESALIASVIVFPPVKLSDYYYTIYFEVIV